MTDTVCRAVDNWTAVNSLLEQALELPEERREAWLSNLPAEYGAVKLQIERLLARGQSEAGERIVGPWRLLRQIGEGGMASVWLAERADGLLKRPVAVKLPHGGWQRDVLAERLQRERDILARLDHPNIARLLDAGFSADGHPYLALEYVSGVRIDEYCRRRGLAWRARLELFLTVADAIAAAHRMLVIHRDIKPSNILVTEGGEVCVLDFGIAKLLDGSQASETELTAWSGRALTFDYASPEQIAGRALTVATDVYSLAVVLHHLLTGERSCERVTVRGDLGTVLTKALKENVAERYTTVDAFAADIRRVLESRPVQARPDSIWYRTSKFVRRHSIGVGASALIAGSVVAGTAGMAWQTRVALEQKQQADATKSSLISLLLDAHAYRGGGKPVTALDLLRQMRRRVDSLQVAPQVRLEVLDCLGASLLSLQDIAGAESVLRQAVNESRALEERHPMRLRARLLLDWALLVSDQRSEVLSDIDDLIAVMRSSAKALPEDFPAALRLRALLFRESGHGEQAELYAREAFETATAKLGPHHNQTVLALVELSLAYNRNGRPQAALATAELACRRALEAYGGSQTHPNVLKARVARAEAFAAGGETARATEEITRAIEDAERLFGPHNRMAEQYRRTLTRIESAATSVRH